MAISVFEPISPAISRTRWMLFSPFDLNKWLVLGFCAFLAGLGEGGGGKFNFRTSWPGHDVEPAVDWVREHIGVIVAVAIGVYLLGFLIYLVMVWLGSRGKFMFIEGVVRNRGAVAEPWREFRPQGNSLFRFRLCIALIAFALVALLLTACGLLAWHDVQRKEFGASAIAAIVGFFVGALPIWLVMWVVHLFAADFIVPVMYLRRTTVTEAWRIFYRELLQGRGGTFALYFVARAVISLIVIGLATMVVCMTCCCAAIPYVGSVILLPLTVFVRSYSLFYIEQFGPAWRILSAPLEVQAEPIEPEQ
ncbi:MAG: hypothetical protein R3C10_02230 [Pirellulales bacterium]